MPNTKSAIRRIKKTKTQALVNKIRKSKYKSAIKKMTSYIVAKKEKEAKNFLPEFTSQLMKVAKSGIVDRKTAARKVSRISKKINNLQKK